MIEMQVINHSTVLSAVELAIIVNAVNHQLTEDVAPVWGTQASDMKIVDPALADPKMWQMVVLDDATQAGALGYHDLTAAGEAIGFVFAKTTMDAGLNVAVTFSHEACEMFGDALINSVIQVSDNPNALFYGQELCDPIEDDSLGYIKEGMFVSDFVTPAYFILGSKGPWDFMKHLNAAATLAPGGYQGTWTPAAGWQQVFAMKDGHAGMRAGLLTAHSRRMRRFKPRADWKCSER